MGFQILSNFLNFWVFGFCYLRGARALHYTSGAHYNGRIKATRAPVGAKKGHVLYTMTPKDRLHYIGLEVDGNSISQQNFKSEMLKRVKVEQYSAESALIFYRIIKYRIRNMFPKDF